MESVFFSKNQCCGCRACEQLCPAGAIEMYPDLNGFLYPQIEQEKCVDCGLCRAACAFGRVTPQPSQMPMVFAARLDDVQERMGSQSGGAFFALARQVLSEGGVVYGAGMTTGVLTVMHMRAETLNELGPIRYSKYVQSDTNITFTQVGKDLKQSRPVLFSGTPCQVNGLNAYLMQRKIDRANCYTVDVLCHGVPSPKLYQDYLTLIREKYGGKTVIHFFFRDKKYKGWGSHIEKAVFFNEKRREAYYSMDYARLFYTHLAHRPSCFHCPYAKIGRCSDISVGDYWGIEEVLPDFWDETGVSVILLNTTQGEQLFRRTNGLSVRESTIADCSKKQFLRGGFAAPTGYDAFWLLYHKKGFTAVSHRYGGNSPLRKALRTIKAAVKDILNKTLLL